MRRVGLLDHQERSLYFINTIQAKYSENKVIGPHDSESIDQTADIYACNNLPIERHNFLCIIIEGWLAFTTSETADPCDLTQCVRCERTPKFFHTTYW
jgi:hypothetical protein